MSLPIRLRSAAYRGAGRPEAIYYIERAVDMIAAELGIDPAAVRRRNYLKPDQFPLQNTDRLDL